MHQPFFIWQNKLLKKIQPEDVIALEVQGNYVKIFVTNDQYYLIRSTMAVALKKLPLNMFKRIHRSLAVSVNYIDDIAKDHLLLDGQENPLPISKQHYGQFIESLNIIGESEGLGKPRKPRGSAGKRK